MIKKIKKNIFNLALGTRNSGVSARSNERNTFNSQQSQEYHTHTSNSHPTANSTNGNNNNISNNNK